MKSPRCVKVLLLAVFYTWMVALTGWVSMTAFIRGDYVVSLLCGGVCGFMAYAAARIKGE